MQKEKILRSMLCNKKIQKIFSITFLLTGIFSGIKVFAFSQKTNFSHIKTGVVNYASSYTTYLPANIKNQVLDWETKHFDIFAGGADVTPFNSNVLWAKYKDHALVYPFEILEMRTFAENNGYIFEDMFLHMKVDYQISNPSITWVNQNKGMDMFDVFEGAKGVFLLNGSTYIDKTDAAYNATNADVEITDKILLGYGEPFAEINFILSTMASGGVTVGWEYWNGSAWSALSLSSDETSSLTQNGKIIFIPPNDWARKTENSSQNKWWIRATVSGGSVKPIATKIYGDNWMSVSGSNNSRGWDESSGTILNSGELAYNPTPPANATAKFRYQARVTGMWAGGAMFGNPANIQNGKRSFAAYLADWILRNVEGKNYNSCMFDDAEAAPGITSPINAVNNYSDYTDNHSGTFVEEKVAQLNEEEAIIKNAISNFEIGKNTLNQQMAYVGSWSLHESPYQAMNTNANNISSGSYVTFDSYLQANNPKGNVGIMHIFDTYADGKMVSDGWVHWDRGNRGPMSALTSYYIAANQNTYFGYNSLGWSYWETDDFIYYDSRSTTLTQDLIVNTSNASKNIYGSDFSAFPLNGNLGLRIGDTDATFDSIGSFTKISNTQLQTTKPIYFSHSAGERIQFEVRGHQAIDKIPSADNVSRWGSIFPAAFVDIGVPDAEGYNEGNRNMTWKLSSEIGGMGGNVWRRDYTKAIILHRPAAYNSTKFEFDNPSNQIDLGGTYYPLFSDGRTGNGVTSISLRTGEGAILMKNPVESDAHYEISNFLSLISKWLNFGSNSVNLNNDEIVNTRDLGIMMSKWQ